MPLSTRVILESISVGTPASHTLWEMKFEYVCESREGVEGLGSVTVLFSHIIRDRISDQVNWICSKKSMGSRSQTLWSRPLFSQLLIV